MMVDRPSRPPSGVRPPRDVVSASPVADRSAQRQSRTPRRATKIHYTPVPIRETHWRRWIVGMLLTVAVLSGAIGWYRYLTVGPEPTRPPYSLPRADASRPSGVNSTSSRPRNEPKRHPSTGPGDQSALPDSFSAKQLDQFLRSQPEGSQLFDRQYRDHEVTWEGIATRATRSDKLLGVEFEDRAGMHILAWCASDAEISSGAAVTVRGRLTRWRADGFVLDECQLL